MTAQTVRGQSPPPAAGMESRHLKSRPSISPPDGGAGDGTEAHPPARRSSPRRRRPKQLPTETETCSAPRQRGPRKTGSPLQSPDSEESTVLSPLGQTEEQQRQLAQKRPIRLCMVGPPAQTSRSREASGHATVQGPPGALSLSLPGRNGRSPAACT
ncbi:hypothetical protein E2562_023298 [Oryza meyeriana var. granulata]|uniref:Uncharacterized protein n=1 Tax=Oryza meyeriana var. granulata TaxID=110450 RepID=A0A6G1DNB7_9ORYZ|nr:hypothetical protein E2562_023298 [Oryza meyeriana var. granulata]